VRHRFHSICPYFAMFPESFAEKWILRLSKPGDFVVDPFSGRGTTALVALLSGRSVVASDVNDVAICLTRAKTSAPAYRVLQRRIDQLKFEFRSRRWLRQASEMPEFFRLAFSRRTLAQLLYLREVVNWRDSDADAMVAALALGSLHGELSSPRYLSNQMPRTISTKPAYSVRFWRRHGLVPPERDLFDTLCRHAAFRYESAVPRGKALTLDRDVRLLPSARLEKFSLRCLITSPPYQDMTNFEEDQWLRLWLLGGPPNPAPGRLSRDDRLIGNDAYWQFICDMWRSFGAVMAGGAEIVVRLGSRRKSPQELRSLMVACSRVSGRQPKLVSSRVSAIKHKQARIFHLGARGCSVEVDFHFRFDH
jgi:hypothetical protein